MRRLFTCIGLAAVFGWMGACARDDSLGAPQGLATGQTDTDTDTDPSTGPEPGTTPPTTSGSEGPTSTAGAGSTGLDEPDTDPGTGASPSGCGDGVLDPGEACDDGYSANLPDAACLPDCTMAACGDGHVQVGTEECDFGQSNGYEYGGCIPGTCLWGPRCGDGVVSPGHELCDPGAPMDPDGPVAPCTSTCRFDGRIVFLSSQTYAGDLGGLSGANLKCQALAKAFDPMRAHTYKAWLSDGVSEPAATFKTGGMFANAAYVLRNGVKVAAGFEDLVQHGPSVGIILTDTYEVFLNEDVWTHTTHEGKAVPDANHCDQWTSDDLKAKAVIGVNALPEGAPEQKAWADERWWTRHVELKCFSPARLYCFEN